MCVVEPECSLHSTHFVVVRLSSEYEPGHSELIIVATCSTRDHTPEVRSQVAGVQG